MRIKTILDKLSNLDLSTYPVEEINKILNELGFGYGAMQYSIGPGNRIVRARENLKDEVFNKASDLSFKPHEFNKTYQRASTPNNTMFYGAIVPDNYKPYGDDSTRAFSLSEVCSLLRNKNIFEGEQIVTFGKWIVTKDIHVIGIVHNRPYLEKNSALKRMLEYYQNSIQILPENIREDSILVTEFFANQFAKTEIKRDYDYLISAIYTERITKFILQGAPIDGILYPSVQTDGIGFNVALTPTCTNSCLQLEKVVECTIYKKGNQIYVDDNKIAILEEGETNFVLEPLTDIHEHIGREKILEWMRSQPSLVYPRV